MNEVELGGNVSFENTSLLMFQSFLNTCLPILVCRVKAPINIR